MKKLIKICLVVAIVASFSISAFATASGFVSSPTGKTAPELVSGKNESADCVSSLIITAFGDRDELSEEACQKIEEAYSLISEVQDLSALNGKIDELAKKLGLESSDLAVSDLFDISNTHCDGHEDHGYFDIKMKAETLKNFVCLLHYYEGEWDIVENAQVTNNGEHLEFYEDEFSPFAIVVSVGKTPVLPTVTQNPVLVAATILVETAVIGMALYMVYVLNTKKSEEEEALVEGDK